MKKGWKQSGVIFELPQKNERLKEIEKLTSDPDFWKNSAKAKKVTKEQKNLETVLEQWNLLEKDLEDCGVFLELAAEGDEEDPEIESELKSTVMDLEKQVSDLEFKKMLGNENDVNDAIVNINAGAGGTEAQDWAEMLLRMYLRWAERKGFKTSIIDILAGEEAGIKSVTFTISGEYAHGYMSAEVGIHRLVRISPFDAGARRHTSFAAVFVYPDIENDIDITIEEKDLRVDTYRASGAGGQHVNKTDSAVRITHLPTKIVTQCQNERSQHMNRETAMKVLKARLYELEVQQQEKEVEKLHSEKKQISWGSQIRSYVMQPYRMVKDHRTNMDVGNVDAVLDGDLDGFIREYLINKKSTD